MQEQAARPQLHRQRTGWLRWNAWWLVLLVPFLGMFFFLQWLGYSERPSEVRLKLAAPDYLSVDAASASWKPGRNQVLDTKSWQSFAGGRQYAQTLRLTNTSGREVLVGIEGLDAGGNDFRLTARTLDGRSLPIAIAPNGNAQIEIEMLPRKGTETGITRTLRLRVVDTAP